MEGEDRVGELFSIFLFLMKKRRVGKGVLISLRKGVRLCCFSQNNKITIVKPRQRRANKRALLVKGQVEQ